MKKLKQANVAECRAIIRAAHKEVIGHSWLMKFYMDRRRGVDDGRRIVACALGSVYSASVVEAANDMFAMAGFNNVARLTGGGEKDPDSRYSHAYTYIRVNSFIQR